MYGVCVVCGVCAGSNGSLVKAFVCMRCVCVCNVCVMRHVCVCVMCDVCVLCVQGRMARSERRVCVCMCCVREREREMYDVCVCVCAGSNGSLVKASPGSAVASSMLRFVSVCTDI